MSAVVLNDNGGLISVDKTVPMTEKPVWSSENDDLLRQVVEARSPELLPLIEIIGRRRLRTEEREALRGALATS